MWSERKLQDKGNDCLISVDGTDFRVPESGKKFFSFKFRKSGLRYEVGLCILTGVIVWINGHYKAGSWKDISIFRNSLKSHLEEGERVEADDGYVGEAPEFIKCPASFTNPQETLFMQQRVRNRQETVNKRLKNWGALKQAYRHKFSNHGEIFRAIIVVTQLAIKGGEPLFTCGYRDPPYQPINEEMSSGSEFLSDEDDNEEDSDEGLSYN